MLDENKGMTRGSAGLCTETLHMFNYLTTDETLREPFLSREILPRFASLMLSVLSELSGKKSLQVKVENMESYHFDPKRMLQEVCLTTVHFVASESFQRAVPMSGYYEKGVPLRKSLDTCAKYGLIGADDKAALARFIEVVETAAASAQDREALLANPPDEFLDELVYTLMSDPVRLPSGNVVNLSTIETHLLVQAGNPKDPFNNQPMTMKDVVPLPELKARIEAWIESKLNPTGSGTA